MQPKLVNHRILILPCLEVARGLKGSHALKSASSYTHAHSAAAKIALTAIGERAAKFRANFCYAPFRRPTVLV